MIQALTIGLIVLFLSSCQSTQTPHQKVLEKRMEEHHQVVKKNSVQKIQYVGLQNAFQFTSTLMVPEVQTSEWRLKQTIYQWSDEELKKRQTEFLEKYGTDAQVFLSFYTPERKQNNLHKPRSKWQVFLWIGDKKYSGQIKKRRDLYEDIRAFFPEHNSWSQPYLVSFPITAEDLKGSKPKLVVTGPVGSGEVKFTD